MLFLANENVAKTIVEGLRKNGHDVLSAKESMRGQPDDIILSRAQAEKRIVLTHDKDFGELAIRLGLPAESGVILIRLSGTDKDTACQRTIEAIESRSDWQGKFSVVTGNRIRMRLL